MPRHLACAQSVAVASLRPMCAHSHALIGEAEKEPPFIGRHRVLISEWRPALSALEALITKVAALESLLEGTPTTQHQQTPSWFNRCMPLCMHGLMLKLLMHKFQLSHKVVLSQLPAIDCAASQAVAKRTCDLWTTTSSIPCICL